MTASIQTDETSSERTFLIDELIRRRRAKRGFTNRPVPIEIVKDILSVARYAPSSSNIQPWQCYVLTGKGRERVVAAAVKAFDDAPEKLFPEYPFFPDPLHELLLGSIGLVPKQHSSEARTGSASTACSWPVHSPSSAKNDGLGRERLGAAFQGFCHHGESSSRRFYAKDGGSLARRARAHERQTQQLPCFRRISRYQSIGNRPIRLLGYWTRAVHRGGATRDGVAAPRATQTDAAAAFGHRPREGIARANASIQ
jgi:nitroreductase